MDTATIEELSSHHLKKYWSIRAYEESGEFCREVWNCRKLMPFVSKNTPGTEMKHLYVLVSSLNDKGVEPLLDKLNQIDSVAQHRIISAVIGDD